MLIAHRLHGMEMRKEDSFGLSLNQLLRRAEIDWHGVRLGQPDWADESHSIACTIRSGPVRLPSSPFWLHLMCNAYWEPLDFDLPPAPETAGSGWRRWIDTARGSPEDIIDPPAAPLMSGTSCRVMPRSTVALFLRIDARS
jgi:glycogen operon protein